MPVKLSVELFSGKLISSGNIAALFENYVELICELMLKFYPSVGV